MQQGLGTSMNFYDVWPPGPPGLGFTSANAATTAKAAGKPVDFGEALGAAGHSFSHQGVLCSCCKFFSPEKLQILWQLLISKRLNLPRPSDWGKANWEPENVGNMSYPSGAVPAAFTSL